MSDPRRREVAELHADHILVDLDLLVGPAVVDLKRETHKTGQDSARTGISTDWCLLFASLFQRKRHNMRHFPCRALKNGRRGSHFEGWVLTR